MSLLSPGKTEEKSVKGHFHLPTNANWFLKTGYKNDPLIFGETTILPK
jgi:hypothetical protein